MIRRAALLAVVALFAAACGTTQPAQETPPTLAPTSEAAPTREVGTGEETTGEDTDLNLGEAGDGLFTAEITGGVTATVAGTGAYACQDGINVLESASGESFVVFSLPPDVVAGEYTIGTGDSPITSELQYEALSFVDNVFGVITLDAAPGAGGEPVSGSFDMNYSSGDISVNVVGEFNLLARTVC